MDARARAAAARCDGAGRRHAAHLGAVVRAALRAQRRRRLRLPRSRARPDRRDDAAGADGRRLRAARGGRRGRDRGRRRLRARGRRPAVRRARPARRHRRRRAGAAPGVARRPPGALGRAPRHRGRRAAARAHALRRWSRSTSPLGFTTGRRRVVRPRPRRRCRPRRVCPARRVRPLVDRGRAPAAAAGGPRPARRGACRRPRRRDRRRGGRFAGDRAARGVVRIRARGGRDRRGRLLAPWPSRALRGPHDRGGWFVLRGL